MDFVKYQSLGNDCVLIDQYRSDLPYFDLSTELAARICDRHFGVGADGVILIRQDATSGLPNIHVFNSDGSKAETCLNGLRCASDYLFQTHNFPSVFQVQIGSRIATCTILETDDGSKHRRIRTDVGPVTYLERKEVVISQGIFSGHAASIGNPHCIFFQKQTPEWLQKYGHEIESHSLFPEKTNVEFVTLVSGETHPIYDLLVYERGCGMTLACGSGAAALVGVLTNLGKILPEQRVDIRMQGGTLSACVNGQGSVVLEALAACVFKGEGDFLSHLVTSEKNRRI
jgi:diaminopimelate epimerase